MIRTGKVISVDKSNKAYSISYLDHVSNNMKKMSILLGDELAKTAKDFKQDDLIEFEWDITGNSPRLKSLAKQTDRPNGTTTTVTSALKPFYNKHSPEERQSIERQVSIKAAVELFAATGFKVKSIEEATTLVIQSATMINKYISNSTEE